MSFYSFPEILSWLEKALQDLLFENIKRVDRGQELIELHLSKVGLLFKFSQAYSPRPPMEIVALCHYSPAIYLPFIACWQRAKNGRKQRHLSEFWLSLHAKDDPKKIWQIWQTTYLQAPKRSWNFSTINQKPSLVCDKHGLRKEKEKEHFIISSHGGKYLSVFIMVNFFDSCSAWLLWTAFAVLMAWLFVEWSTR